MSWQSKSAAVAIAIMAMSLHSSSVQAMPEQGKVVAGQGEIVRPDDKTMVINQKTDRLALDWQKFNIAKDEKVHFDQNSKSAIAINRVVGDGRSIIDGSLSATGNVFVINPNGVLFGKNSSVDVGGLVASTANVTDEDMRNFTQGKGDLGLQIAAGREASVINAGTIKAEGGLVALHATTVENTGTIANEGGTTALAAAKNLNIAADTAGKLNFTVNGSLANAKALNSGTLQNDGGYLVMTAKSAGDLMSTVVNNTGVIEAKTLHANDKGEILLDGGESGQVEVSGTLDASGTEAGQSAGSIKVIGQKTVVNDGTNLLARGAIDGGKIETSGDVLNLGDNLNIDAKGERGKAGEWLLDPLNVYIVAKADIPSDSYTITPTKTNSIQYADPTTKDNVFSNGSTYISSEAIQQLLNKDTNVTIQAAAVNKAASITINAPIEKTEGQEATFQLEAQRSIIVNKEVSSSSGKLHINFYSDTDGDSVGVIDINANINTNGGNLNFGSGGDVNYADSSTKAQYNKGKLTGTTNHTAGTVGTYFGHVSGETGNRIIRTNGGDVNLYGDVSIGLNGDNLILNTAQDNDATKGGSVTVTGTVDSGNAYQSYMQGDSNWNALVESFVNTYGIPYYWYKGINYDVDGTTYTKKYTKQHFDAGVSNGHYVIPDEGTDSIPMRMTANTSIYHTDAGDGYAGVEVSVKYASLKDKYGVNSYSALTDTQKKNVSDQVAHNWFAAQIISQGGLRNAETGIITSSDGTVQKGPTEVGGSYLATLATVIENSLVAPSSSKMLFVGGRGSGIRGRTYKNDQYNPYSWVPADPNRTDGFYWVTGPEGEANNRIGTKFWDTTNTNAQSDITATGRPVDGYYTKWTSDKSQKNYQPDNSGTFLTVGYGADSNWDDSNPGGTTVVGFVKETNLAHSGLSVQAGNGEVKLEGNIGYFNPLNKLDISTTKNVSTGASNSTDYNNRGNIFVDNNVNIIGATVNIGDRITSGIESDGSPSDEANKVNITAFGDLIVNGITAQGDSGTISLTSKGPVSKIELGSAHSGDASTPDNGTLNAGSKAANAVIIDVQGTRGAFVNSTSKDAANAITTGRGGSWKVYSASPDLNTFGTNLNSGTDAMWNSTSKSFDVATAADINSDGTQADGKYIFQVQPTITVSGANTTKTYGVNWDDKYVKENLISYTASYTNSDNEAFDVKTGKDKAGNAFINAFQEKDYTNYISNKDGSVIGDENMVYKSLGAKVSANRENGDKIDPADPTKYLLASSDNAQAVYNLSVKTAKDEVKAIHGYDLKPVDGSIEITKRKVTVGKDGHITYGSDNSITYDAPTSGEATSTTGLTNGDTIDSVTMTPSNDYQTSKGSRNTADAGRYDLTTDGTKTTILNKGKDVSVNYDISGSGTLTVDKAVLVVDTADGSRVYGDTNGVLKDLVLKKAVSFHLKDSNAKTTNGDKEDDIFNALGLKVDSSALIRDKGGNPLKTNDVNENPGYDVTASFNQLPNYIVEKGKVGKEKIKPKDVYFHVTGNGKTIGDVVYTVTDTNPNPDYPLNPNDPINSQLVYGETVTPSYTPDGRLPNGHYGVSTSLPGYGPIESGKVYGNYRYHYDGDVTLTTPSKPDIVPPVNPPVMPGTGTVTPLPETPENTSNTPENTTETTGHKTVWDGDRDRGGDRPEDKRVVTLPFFKVLEDKTTHRYGTYDVAKRTTEVKIAPSAQVLPEPNQPATQYRELDTELTTDKGTGEFTLKYNGSRFTILPDDDAATHLIVVGDETKNRDLFEKALHVAFTQMGLEVADLDGVYIHFGKD